MISNARRKAVLGLQRKKERLKQNRFPVEGPKCVGDLLQAGWPVHLLAATEDWVPPPDVSLPPVTRVTPEDLQRLSGLETAQKVLAVAGIPPPPPLFFPAGCRVLGLDGIQDPGNFGTLLRIADWFGFAAVVRSPDSVDPFNPKAVQASMGSLFRVPLLTASLETYILDGPEDLWSGGAVLHGNSLFDFHFPETGLLVVGNESRGIRAETAGALNDALTIPGYGGAESLNVAAAAAVLCAEWTRQLHTGTEPHSLERS